MYSAKPHFSYLHHVAISRTRPLALLARQRPSSNARYHQPARTRSTYTPTAAKMSTMARRTTLHDIPSELLESLLVVQPPATLCAVASTSRLLRAAAADPGLWRTVARRTLSVDAANVQELRAAADQLVCAWSARAGALVHGVPVHFRKRFTAVRERGATSLVRIRSARDDAALAMGTSDDHGPAPALEMDFALHKNGPLPVDGFVARIVAAPVPATRSPPASPTRSPRISPPSTPRLVPRFPRPSELRSAGERRRKLAAADANTGDAVSANAHVLLNGEEIGTHHLAELCVFGWTDIHLPARLLRKKPQMNTLAVEYVAENSNAAYWLKSVRIVPTVLPMQDSPPKEENVPLRHVRLPNHDASFHGAFGDHDSHVHKNSSISRRHSVAYSRFERLNLGC